MPEIVDDEANSGVSPRESEIAAVTSTTSYAPPPPPPPPLPHCASGIPDTVPLADLTAHFDIPHPPPQAPCESPAAAYFQFPYYAPVGRRSGTGNTIERISRCLPSVVPGSNYFSAPIAVAIGPYHHGSFPDMEPAKRAAVQELCRLSGKPRTAVRAKIRSVEDLARRCYSDRHKVRTYDEDQFTDMMLSDGCFLLQFMASMCPDDPEAPPEADPLMARAEVHTRIEAIARDVLLLENQVPWPVLELLMGLFRPAVPVDRFLALMATAFDVGNIPAVADDQDPAPWGGGGGSGRDRPRPPHLLGLFHRRQVGAARTQSLRVPRLSSLGSSALELAEMGVKLTAGKSKGYGDMAMSKCGPLLGLFGELSLAPFVVNELTKCWLVNMAAYEASIGATQADNFAVSSYISVVAMLIGRKQDVQELRAKGIIHSTMCDALTLNFFKEAAQHVRVGHRYFHISECIQAYKQERWMWIPVHRFFYNNIKAIVAVLSAIGVLAGIFKTILSLKQPQR
ncbi:hypothetical protein ACP4OV_015965 [Aristida adscensionis]